MSTSEFWFQTTGGGPDPGLIGSSIRIRGSAGARLFRDFSGAPDHSGQPWTLSFWMKRGSDLKTSTWGNDLHMVTWSPVGTCANASYCLIADPDHSNSAIRSGISLNGGNLTGNTANKLRDPSAWYHIFWRGNQGSTNAFYINGRAVDAWQQGPGSSAQPLVNNACRLGIGNVHPDCGNIPFDGKFAEMHFVDGVAHEPTDFGEFNDNGTWIPRRVSGVTYGTNGWYLDFSDPDDIGADRSGNGNNFDTSQMELSNTSSLSYDWSADSPTNNFGRWDPLEDGPNSSNGYSSQLWNANKLCIYRRDSGDYFQTATQCLPSSGRYYWEVRCDNAPGSVAFIGIAEQNWTWNSSPTVRYGNGGSISNHVSNPEGSPNTTGPSWGAGDTIGCAWNADTQTMRFYKNGLPVGADIQPTVADGSILFSPIVHAGTNDWQFYINLGDQPALGGNPPPGYEWLSTATMPEVAITNSSGQFQTVEWAGNDTTRDIIVADGGGNTWAPDLVWIKMKDGTMSHYWYDTIRGANQSLSSDSTRTETTDVERLTAFNSDGFELGSSARVNSSPNNYIAWCWNAGDDAPAQNTNGSIPSMVKANQAAGFSVVTWSTPATGGHSVGHGLGAVPKFAMIKSRTGAFGWNVYHNSLGNDSYIELNGSRPPVSSSGIFNPSNTTMTFSSAFANSTDYVGYFFAEIPGFSAFGDYQAYGSDDGPVINLGFRPALIIIKRFDNDGSWHMYDSSRYPYNFTANDGSAFRDLTANTNGGEASSDNRGVYLDFLANGFKIRSSAGFIGGRCIYMAWAESPFGGSNVSPSPAR